MEEVNEHNSSNELKITDELSIINEFISEVMEDVNLNIQNLSYDISFFENMNVSCIEESCQSLTNNELRIAKENYELSKYDEECIERDASHLKCELKKREEKDKSVMSKKLAMFIAAKELLVNKYNTLKITNEQLLQKLSESEHAHTTALKKVDSLKNEVQNMQQDKMLADEKNKNTVKNIIENFKKFKFKVSEEMKAKSVDELFEIFYQTILKNEEEIIRTFDERFLLKRKLFIKEKQQLNNEKRQSEDAEKRMSVWAKELECEIEKLQIAFNESQNEIARLNQLLEEANRDREASKEISLLEMDSNNNLETEYNKHSNDMVNEEAITTAQKQEKQAQEAIKSKECNKRDEDLVCTTKSLKRKNMDLTNDLKVNKIRKLSKKKKDKKDKIIKKMQKTMKKLKKQMASLKENNEPLYTCELHSSQKGIKIKLRKVN